MPQLAKITATFFTSLIARLGIRPPFSEGFEMSNVVTPVSIVDSDVTLSAVTSSLLLQTNMTTGPQPNPSANTVLADSGALSAGNYTALMIMSVREGTTNPSILIQRRNAANSANIWEHRYYFAVNTGNNETLSIRLELAVGERFRIVVDAAGGSAGSTWMASLWIAPSS